MDIEKLYKSGMSIREVSRKSGIPLSTVHRRLKAAGVLRNKSVAQKNAIKRHGHPRDGVELSEDTKDKIRKAQNEFWQSEEAQEAKAKIAAARKREWSEMTARQKHNAVEKLLRAPRPRKGTLTNFGKAVFDYFTECGIKCKSEIFMPERGVAAILLVESGTVLEFASPKFLNNDLLGRERDSLRTTNYHLVVVINHSNSVSKARCELVRKAITEDPKIEVIEIS